MGKKRNHKGQSKAENKLRRKQKFENWKAAPRSENNNNDGYNTLTENQKYVCIYLVVIVV
jgi:hypothetical protein